MPAVEDGRICHRIAEIRRTVGVGRNTGPSAGGSVSGLGVSPIGAGIVCQVTSAQAIPFQ